MQTLNLQISGVRRSIQRLKFRRKCNNLRLESIALRLKCGYLNVENRLFSAALLLRKLQLRRLRRNLSALKQAEPSEKTAYECDRISHTRMTPNDKLSHGGGE